MSTIDRRTLNRTRLRRQWLTEPREATPVRAMEHLVGLQAQLGDPPYYQLWSRLANFTVDDLSASLLDKSAVRVALMRGTIHLVSARDCLALRPVLQASMDKTLFNGSQYGKRVTGVDLADLIAEGRRLLAAAPLSNDVLASGLAERFPGYAGTDLAYVLRCAMPLIQVPPRGVWGEGGALTYASTSQWLGAEPAATPDVDDVIRRYLAAFGPATIQDFQVWAGLTQTKPAFERLRDRLVVHHDADGRELFDLPELELADPDEPLAPVVLGPFDNILLSHRDREFVISKAAQKRVFTQNGIVKGTILIDGFVAASWKPVLKKKSARIEIEPFETLNSKVRQSIASRARRLLDFAAPDADSHAVEFG
ncbi:MAG: winged helix DNA-binding domain-containing protein [Stackebrandtia sp.]